MDRVACVVLNTNITIFQCLPVLSWITVYDEMTIPEYTCRYFTVFLGLNYVSIHCHVVISKDSRFRLVKQLRPDTFRFIDQRFQNRVRVNEVNLNQEIIKLVRVSWEFELTEFELCGSK